jgi:plastocyanin
MNAFRFRWWLLAALLLVCILFAGASSRVTASGPAHDDAVRQIIVPDEDRFTPFAITVRVGQTVEWVNNDTDDHTVVSDDAFNTAGHRGVNVILPANGGTFRLKFKHPGVFPFYCRFHAMLDADNQPKAPGPDGGIQDPDGNFGTPMNGVVTVLGED